MPWVVIVETCSTMDSYGARTYQSCASYRAAIQGPQQFRHQATQQVMVSRQTVIVGSASPITGLDRLTLPTAFLQPGQTVAQPPILEVQLVSDGHGLHHAVVYCG